MVIHIEIESPALWSGAEIPADRNLQRAAIRRRNITLEMFVTSYCWVDVAYEEKKLFEVACSIAKTCPVLEVHTYLHSLSST